MDGQDGDLSTGLSTCITKDGQTTVTADISFSSHKLTNVTDGTNAQDAATIAQLQSKSGSYFVATGGTVDAYAVSPTPNPPLASGLTLLLKMPATNATNAPTLAVSMGTAKAIVNADLSSVNPGDLGIGGIYEFTYESTADKWLLPNKIAQAAFGFTNAGYKTASFTATVDNATYTVYPATAGMYVGLNNSSVSAGKFIMFVYVGPYPLYIYGTINGVAQTIAYTQRQNFILACTTIDGWV